MSDDRQREDPSVPLVVARVVPVCDFARVKLSVRIHTQPIGGIILRAEPKKR